MDDRLGIFRLRLPHDGVQGIIKEMGVDLGLQHAQLGPFQVFLFLLVLFDQTVQADGHGIQALGQGHELPGLHIRGPGVQLAVGDLAGEALQLPDLALDEPGQMMVDPDENQDHHAPQRDFHQPAHDKHQPGFMVFARFPGDAIGDIILHQIPS